MSKPIYYTIDFDGSYAVEHAFPINDIWTYPSWAELVKSCLELYGQDIEFHEVTPDNWKELYESGAFEK